MGKLYRRKQKLYHHHTMEEYYEHTVWRHLRENAESIINSEWDCDILKHQQSIFLETACKQHESHKIKRKIKLKSGYRNASCKENRTVFSVTSFPMSFTYNNMKGWTWVKPLIKRNKTNPKSKGQTLRASSDPSDECAWTLWFLRQVLQHSLWAGMLHFWWLILAL